MQSASETSGGDSVSMIVEESIDSLLVRSGAKLRGRNRADCPDCGGKRTVSTNELKGVFHCHHAGCSFSGGVDILKKRLGIQKKWIPRNEYFCHRQEQQRIDEAARRLYDRIQERRQILLDVLHAMNDMEMTARFLGVDSEESWNAVEMVHGRRPALLAELAILENSTAADLLRFLDADTDTRQLHISRVIERGGLYDSDRKFVEVDL